MHELGIVFHVIKSVEEIAQENELTKVSAVTLSIGEVSGIVPSYLTDCWRWAADRTEVLSGSELNIETIHAVTHCDDCGCNISRLPAFFAAKNPSGLHVPRMMQEDTCCSGVYITLRPLCRRLPQM